jgi:putative ABC transport system ATP-binding protein
MIKVNGLTKHYQDVDRQLSVLQDLNFTIEKGQTIALMGQSGSGKSTLLHLLGGFDRVSSGSVCIDDNEITTMNDEQLSLFRRRHLGMVFQQYNLIPCLNAKDNITFVRRLNGMKALDEHCEQLIEVLALTERLNHYPQQLSGGEQQRVAIARALASEPSLILADEPTGNLDEETAAEVMSLLVKAVEFRQATMLLVTHSKTTADYLQHTWRLVKGALQC